MNDGPRRASLLVLFLTVFIDLLGFGIVLPLLPIYADQMTDAKWMVGVLMASFSAMQFLFSPLWGRISDRIGRRPVIMIGLAGSVVFYALFGYATWAKDMTMLFVSRIGAGIAGATIATAQAYIADSTTMQGRTKGMALIGAAFGLGFTFGPLVGLLAIPTGQGDPARCRGCLPPGFRCWPYCWPPSNCPSRGKPGRQPAAATPGFRRRPCGVRWPYRRWRCCWWPRSYACSRSAISRRPCRC